MSNFQRSRSAPHFRPSIISSHDFLHPHRDLRAHPPRRNKTAVDLPSVTHAEIRRTPIVSPRTERDDPFNLGGFFPTQLRSADEGHEWNWLRHREAEDDVQDPTDLDFWDENTLPAAQTQTLFGQADEAATGAVIQGEDKLGVLSLCMSALSPYVYHI